MMAQRREKGLSMTATQKEIMIDFIHCRREMFTGRLTPTYTKETMAANWIELANILNSIPGGPSKEWKLWRKSWVDLKKNMQAKLVDNKRYSQGTGGGPPLPPIMDKMVDIISPVDISGDEDVLESEVIFDFEGFGTTYKPGSLENATKKNVPEFDHYYIMSPTSPLNCTSMDASMKITPNDFSVGPSTSKEVKPVSTELPTSTPEKKSFEKERRITKTTRLQESLKANERFLRITESNIQLEREFKKKSWQLWRLIPKTEIIIIKKIEALQTITSAAVQIANSAETLVIELRELNFV